MVLKIAIYVLFLSTLIAGCSGKKKEEGNAKKNQGPVIIDAVVIKAEAFKYFVDASGTVLAQEFVELRPETSGRIVKLNISEGVKIPKGTLILKLNDDELQAQLKKNKSQLDIAVKTEKRLKSLLEVNGLNQQEYDVAANQVNNLNADIDYLNAQIRKTEVRAPFDGLIGLRNVSEGAYVTPQNIITTIQQTDNLKIDFQVPEGYNHLIKKGKKVKVQSGNSDTLDAEIIAIEPQLNTNTRNLKVRAVVSKNGSLSPGSFVKVLLETDNNNKAILIPSNSIIPESRNKKVALIKNGVATFQIVETGFRTQDKVEITKGLNVNDTIATSGLLYLKPDAPVKYKSIK